MKKKILIASLITIILILIFHKWILYSVGKITIKNENYELSQKILEIIYNQDPSYKNVNVLLRYCNAKMEYGNGDINSAGLETVYDIVSSIDGNYSGDYHEEVLLFRNLVIDTRTQIREKAVQEDIDKYKNRVRESIDGCPLVVNDVIITENAIGRIRVSLSCTNNSSKTIDTYEAYIYCYDKFGDPVKKSIHDGNVLHVSYQNQISANCSLDGNGYYWDTYGFENASIFIPYIIKIHYTNGEEWRLDEEIKEGIQNHADLKAKGEAY